MGFDMNKLALGILVAVGFSATAQAADIDVSPRPVAPMVMIYNWSGFYVGAHGGGAWGKSNWLNTASSAPLGLYPDLVPGDPNGHNISGWLAGGQMGYNFQSGALVYGLELSGSAADLTPPRLDLGPGGAFGQACTVLSSGPLAAIVEHAPDVALLDYKMPGLDGIAVAHAVTRDGLSTRVLLLSATTEGSVVYKAIQDGAAGYLSKDSDRDEIVNAVVACARGEKVLPPDLVTSLATQVHRHAQTHGPLLSERERQTLRMIADGKTVRDMAKELFLAETTIKTHIRRLYEKLGVSDRGAAVAYAMRNNLLE